MILVILRWKRPVVKRATPPETVAGATRAAIRYVRYSPGVLRVLARAGAGMFFASALLALLPSLAHRISGSPVGYGVLLGGFGGGAVLGALVLQRARDRWSADVIVSVGIAAFGLVTMASGVLHAIWLLGAVMVVGGAAWVSFMSLLNVHILSLAPDWVRARVLSIAMLVFQGAVAAGSATWGGLAARRGIDTALLWEELGDLLADGARQLDRAGADFIVLCTNTMHKLADCITNSVGIPLLHIADAVGQAIQLAGQRRVGLLGTRFTMEQPFYSGRLRERFGIETIVPSPSGRTIVHDVIYHELCHGVIREESRAAFQRVIAGLAEEGAESVILGCTEIGLLIAQADSILPVHDSTQIHAHAAVDFALE